MEDFEVDIVRVYSILFAFPLLDEALVVVRGEASDDLRGELGVWVGVLSIEVKDVLAGRDTFVDVVRDSVAIEKAKLLKAAERIDQCALLWKLANFGDLLIGGVRVADLANLGVNGRVDGIRDEVECLVYTFGLVVVLFMIEFVFIDTELEVV